MVPTETSLFQLLSARMTWLGQRQAVLGQNVANADTPDYRPRDLREKDFERLVETMRHPERRVAVTRSHPVHLAGSGGASVLTGGRPQDATYEVAPDGNAVVLEEQLARLGEAALAYQTTTNLYQKYVGMVRTALGTSR